MNEAATKNGPTLPYSLWQPVFDRDFASPVELFQIPLYGPDTLTTKISAAPSMMPTYPTVLDESQTAGSRFLHPEGANVADASDDNRWYRLLGIVETPSRLNRFDPSIAAGAPGSAPMLRPMRSLKRPQCAPSSPRCLVPLPPARVRRCG